jgi:hypothetical protein
MGLGDRFKELLDRLGGRAGRALDELERDDTDSAAAPIVNNPPDLISASEADLDGAGFPPELR